MEASSDAEVWKYYVDVGLWPVRAKFDPASWLSNFTDAELPYARRLLAGFTYYSVELVEQMFRSAFANLSQHAISDRSDLPQARAEWAAFLRNVIVVRVTGENPHDADSGFLFARMARDILRLPEQQIVSPADALARITARQSGNVVFVDDFVGSGKQFIENWERLYSVGSIRTSFSKTAPKLPGIKSFYVPVMCTEYGRRQIARRAANVRIVPAHFLLPEYSALSTKSMIWREDMQTTGPAFIEQASKRAGIPDLNGKVGCWRGFHKLGLTLAFHHGYPDATLPLFYWDQNNWKPLIKSATL